MGKHRSGRLIFPKRNFTSLGLSDGKFYMVKINLIFRLSAVFAFAATLDAADIAFPIPEILIGNVAMRGIRTKP